MQRRLKVYLFNFLGGVFVLLALVGMLLPLLPTTPFLILALACFARGSERFHHKLLNNRWFGPGLRQWEENRSISKQNKQKALFVILFTFSISIYLLRSRWYLQLLLLIIGSCLVFWMKRLKESDPM